MITADQFLDIVRKDGKDKALVRLGEVSSIDPNTGRPSIIFDGETEPSVKRYTYIDSYTPTEGDRVLLIAVGNTYVVLGKIV